jgi:hypothetical protein
MTGPQSSDRTETCGEMPPRENLPIPTHRVFPDLANSSH